MHVGRTILSAALVLGVTFAGSAGADEPPGELVAQASAWWKDDDPIARGAWALRLIASGASGDVVAAAIEKGRGFSDDVPKGTVHTWRRPGRGGLEHTCFLVVPQTYDPTKPMRLLVWLHGGVTRDEDGGGASGVRSLGQRAAEEGFLLLCPSARTGAEWWSVGGVELIHGALADVRRRYHVDADRIACAGFSDGASGCYHLLLHQPEPFCCFLALMGQPLVTRLAGGPSAAANVASRPIWAVHGERDTLYPSAAMRPLMDELKTAGADLTWTDLPGAGHDLAALGDRWSAMKAFWDAHPRTPRAALRWQSSVPTWDGRLDWLEILETSADETPVEGLEAVTLPVPPPRPRPRLGIRLDSSFAGPGVRIDDVEAGTAAATAGMLVGDVLVEVEGQPIRTAQDLVALRDTLDRLGSEGRDGRFVLMRGEERVEVSARPTVVASDLEVPTPTGPGIGAPAGVAEAKIVSPQRIEVRCRGVRRLRLHLDPAQIALDAPLTVVVNGEIRFEGVPRRGAAYVLNEAWRDGGVPRYHAHLVLAP